MQISSSLDLLDLKKIKYGNQLKFGGTTTQTINYFSQTINEYLYFFSFSSRDDYMESSQLRAAR